MRTVVAVEKKIPYRLYSQEQTLFGVLAQPQRGRNNRINGPFGACQKKKVSSGLSFLKQKGVQTNRHRRQERGARNSMARLQSNEVHSGAWYIR